MDHFKAIYSHRAADYHRLISPEDVEGNLRPALEAITSFKNKRILDLGSGTGRLPLLVGAEAAHLIGLELYGDMLREQQRQRRAAGGNWSLLQGDMRDVPLPSSGVEVVTAGWALGHFTGWYGPDWQEEIGRVLTEMHRLATPGGALIIIETLSTGRLTPAPPSEGLARYYGWLEQEWGFTRQEIRTDYQFESVDQAVARTEFFFGPELAAAVRANNWARLPEWTGVWGKQL